MAHEAGERRLVNQMLPVWLTKVNVRLARVEIMKLKH